MKRKVISLTLAALFTLVLIPTTAYANDNIRVTINGQQVTFEGQGPVIIDGRTLIPIRGVFEQLGFTFDWDATAYLVTLTRDNLMVGITLHNEIFNTSYGGSGPEFHRFDTEPQIIGGSTMVPIRAVLESVGYYLDWDSAIQTVLISTTPFGGQVQQPVGGIPPYITIGGVQYSTALTELRLNDKEGDVVSFEEFAQLRYMVNLTIFNMGNTFVESGLNLSPLAGLTNLTSLSLNGLSLSSSQITDLGPLAGLTNLTRLSLMNGQVSDLSPLSGLTNLTNLTLDGNFDSHTDVSPLAGLTNLTSLSLIGGPIKDLSPLAGLTNLTGLSFSSSQITDLSPLIPLAGLPNLTSLSLGNNQISDLSPLAGFTNLTRLALTFNQISDLSPLAGLTNLTNLTIYNNRAQVTDWSPVAHVNTVEGRPLNWND